MCGEHGSMSSMVAASGGSSPHVRGAPLVNIIRHFCTRDHPRMCGEHSSPEAPEEQDGGSSPHVRGAPIVTPVPVAADGIIPACAGSTNISASLTKTGRDHPRMCGEHAAAACVDARLMGSSPHVRGALANLALHVGHAGIIPACAGSTRERQRQRGHGGDHPRMCGEHHVDAYQR